MRIIRNTIRIDVLVDSTRLEPRDVAAFHL